MCGATTNLEWPLGLCSCGDRKATALIWAPYLEELEVRFTNGRHARLERGPEGYHFARLSGICPGDRYFLRSAAGADLPDPASRYQPEGVHGPSEVVEPGFKWEDGTWPGLALKDYILYELHTGTFSPEGTFDGVAERIPKLKDIGVTVVELMPVAQFPGPRNWGYDGVFPFGVQNTYGGPQGLKRLVNTCHRAGLGVVLDVVYNHLGPEGNYLAQFGPYFTDTYRTPWGAAINFDGEYSDAVRRFFIENALFWQTEFHLDGLRLDAIHAIRDFSARPFLAELGAATRARAEQLHRPFQVIGESDLNDPRTLAPEDQNGWQLDAQWSDDFHHALHVLLTGEQGGYYADFGGVRMLARVFRQGYAFTGQHSIYRKRSHGRLPQQVLPRRFVVCSQNHDQIGNRALGERLTRLTSFEGLKVAAAAVLLSPFTPLLFMGEEYGETAPFLYFTSHGDPELAEAVRRGRREEFSGFVQPDKIPDPQEEQTFLQSGLQAASGGERGTILRGFYRELIGLRQRYRLGEAGPNTVEVAHGQRAPWLLIEYRFSWCRLALLLWFGSRAEEVMVPLPGGDWRLLIHSNDPEWLGKGTEFLAGADGSLRVGREPDAALFIAARDAEESLSPEQVEEHLEV